jgi:hypothetical protein
MRKAAPVARMGNGFFARRPDVFGRGMMSSRERPMLSSDAKPKIRSAPFLYAAGVHMGSASAMARSAIQSGRSGGKFAMYVSVTDVARRGGRAAGGVAAPWFCFRATPLTREASDRQRIACRKRFFQFPGQLQIHLSLVTLVERFVCHYAYSSHFTRLPILQAFRNTCDVPRDCWSVDARQDPKLMKWRWRR